MRYLIGCLILLMLSGCYMDISGDILDEMYQKCESNGGIDYIWVDTDDNRVIVHCENDAMFRFDP